MTTDTASFLETLLFIADNPDDKRRPFQSKSIYDFHPEFAAAVDSFLSGFRDYLASQPSPLAARVDDAERSFGGNVLFSLSGHGCGFFDDRDGDLGHYLHAAVATYSGSKHRFEELEHNLSISRRTGKIHLAFRRPYRREMLARYFTVTK